MPLSTVKQYPVPTASTSWPYPGVTPDSSLANTFHMCWRLLYYTNSHSSAILVKHIQKALVRRVPRLGAKRGVVPQGDQRTASVSGSHYVHRWSRSPPALSRVKTKKKWSSKELWYNGNSEPNMNKKKRGKTPMLCCRNVWKSAQKRLLLLAGRRWMSPLDTSPS